MRGVCGLIYAKTIAVSIGAVFNHTAPFSRLTSNAEDADPEPGTYGCELQLRVADQPALACDGDRLAAVLDVQPLQNLPHVVFDGRFAE